MAIADTSFYSSYQTIIGATYARGYDQVYNPSYLIPNYVTARQNLLSNLASSEVSNALVIVNAHLSAENTFNTGTLNIARGVLQATNTFFQSTYGVVFRDYFDSSQPTKTIAWQNSFKEAWYQANNQELTQQIGFITWNGSTLVNYPAYSAATNIQNTASVASISGNVLTLSNIPIVTNFALPGDVIVASTTGSIPSVAAISLGTTVVGYANSNTITLSGGVDPSTTTIFSFRPIKNPEFLEFRLGTAGVTGLAATAILSNIGLAVTLSSGVTTTVTLGTTNTTGRFIIGVANNSTYKSVGISSISITTGSVTGLGTQPSIELWTRS